MNFVEKNLEFIERTMSLINSDLNQETINLSMQVLYQIVKINFIRTFFI